MLPPIAADLSRDALIEAVRRETDEIDLDGCALHTGWENVVLESRDGWILRFPRDATVDFIRELATLEQLRRRLPAGIPVVEWTGQYTRFAAYRALTGARLRIETYAQAPEPDRLRVAVSLADFLAAMHSALAQHEIDRLGVPQLDHTRLITPVDQALAGMSREAGRPVRRLRDRFVERWVDQQPADPVLLHNDYHLHNLVLAEPLGEVSGVWDFSCVALGEASFDFRYLVGDSADLADRTAAHYTAVTGRAVDLDAALLAQQFEAVSDALVEGRPLPAF